VALRLGVRACSVAGKSFYNPAAGPTTAIVVAINCSIIGTYPVAGAEQPRPRRWPGWATAAREASDALVQWVEDGRCSP